MSPDPEPELTEAVKEQMALIEKKYEQLLPILEEKTQLEIDDSE